MVERHEIRSSNLLTVVFEALTCKKSERHGITQENRTYIPLLNHNGNFA
jgi:hypothetical protein